MIKLDKEDKFYAIKLNTINDQRLSDLEAAENFEKKKHKKKKKLNLVHFSERRSEALRNQKVKALIDFDEEYSSSIKSLAVKQNDKVNLTTRYLNGKMLMFSKVSIKSFVYDLIDVFMFPNEEIKKIYAEFKVDRCYLYQNLTDTDSTSIFFVFICDLKCSIDERKSRDIISKVMIKSKIFERLDLSDDFWDQFGVQNKKLKKQVGLFEIESINKANVITIALNPKEYYERFDDHSDNKKHKELKKSTRSMDFDSYSSRLANLNEFSKELFKKPKKIQQKIFQIINNSMQMKAVSKVQFGQLNYKRFYFSNGLMSLSYGHPYLEDLRKEKQKYRAIHKTIQDKKYDFLKQESNAIDNNPRMHVLKQIFAQSPMFYILNSTIISITKGWKSTKEQILNSSWK